MEEYTVAYLLENNRDKIILGCKDDGMWKERFNGFGGKVEKGEDHHECIIRELGEETNIDIESMVIDRHSYISEVNFMKHGRPLGLKSKKDFGYICYSKLHVYLIDIDNIKLNDDKFNSSTHNTKRFMFSNGFGMPYPVMPDTDVYWLPHVLSNLKEFDYMNFTEVDMYMNDYRSVSRVDFRTEPYSQRLMRRSKFNSKL